ncbi:GP179 protein, partial [Donacobius atricapilla]|nr:GP179 protein [Donacobius atricapilla]
CPWEVAEPQVEKRTGPGKERLPGKEETKALEKGSRDRESVCPWESLDTKQPPTTGSPALPKAAPGKSQSSEKAEICPWEVESSSKSEICPWEVAEPQVEKGTGPGKEKLPPKGASTALEKGSRDRESVCPWESPDTEQLSLKTAVGKEPSKK